MIKKTKLLVSALCSFMLMSQAVMADDTLDVESAVERLRVVMIDPDQAQLEALTASDLSYGHSSGKVDTQEVFVGNLMSGASNFVTLNASEQTIKVVGDTAIVRHILTGETHSKGKEPARVSLKALQIWKKQGNDWKLLARQAVTLN